VARTERPLDQRGRRTDVCPTCGGERAELVVVPDRFYCAECQKATEGPNTKGPPPPPEEQLGLDMGLAENVHDQYDRPPVDDYDMEPPPDEA
jgi:hypothetical protein